MHQEIAVLIPIVAILSGAWITVTILRMKQTAGGGSQGQAESRDADLRAAVARLEQRLAVIERITVEKENSLEREIEQLRRIS